jgi:putative ATP-dependent endonuclease of the OLD family
MWNHDFPLKMQKREPAGGSTITLEFDLTPEEVTEFTKTVGSKLNGTLPISYHLLERETKVEIPKPGRGHKALSAKAGRIADFVANKIGIQYIPAVRTAEFAQDIVSEMVRLELGKIENDPKFKQALDDIAALQEPVLAELSKSITATMKEFLPNIVSAKVTIQEGDRTFALREISELLVNDGVETALISKGDGVQSLAALALMRHSSQAAHQGKDVIIALEEPESHLHPKAIRQLRKVLMELSARYQVVVTTHNPIFTNRLDVHQNIIVRQSRAYAAKSVKEVRDVLGVRLDDNLSSAEVILVVEGEEDRIVLASILPKLDKELAKNFETGRVAIDVLGGATNLCHRVRVHTEAVCRVHAFLDNDQTGRNAFDAASKEGLLDGSSVNFAMVGGKTESELEDLYTEDTYEAVLQTEVGLPLLANGPDKARKWSERVKNLLRQAGKIHDPGAIQVIKLKVARSVAHRGVDAIHPSKIGPIESLKNSLLAKLQDA